MLTVYGTEVIGKRGVLVWFGDTMGVPPGCENMDRGSRLRRSDGVEWEVIGVETMGYKRTGAYLVKGNGALSVGDELTLLPALTS